MLKNFDNPINVTSPVTYTLFRGCRKPKMNSNREEYIDNSMTELYNYYMEMIADASVFLAVVLDGTDRKWVIEKTSGSALSSPEVLPYGIANALSAMKRRGRLTDREALKAFSISQGIPVRLVPVRIHDALKIAVEFSIYAYDAFYLQCCLETKLPLLSLDNRMCEVAGSLSIKVVI